MNIVYFQYGWLMLPELVLQIWEMIRLEPQAGSFTMHINITNFYFLHLHEIVEELYFPLQFVCVCVCLCVCVWPTLLVNKILAERMRAIFTKCLLIALVRIPYWNWWSKNSCHFKLKIDSFAEIRFNWKYMGKALQ